MKNFIFLTIFLLPFNILADEVKLTLSKRVEVSDYKLGIGSEASLQFLDKNLTLNGMFLGRMITHPEYGDEFLFLNGRTGKVLMVDSESVKSSIPKSSMQPLISTIDQMGETCAAYAIYHYWQQIEALGAEGELMKIYSSERTRMQFLEESISSYYMGRTINLNTILNKFGKRFDKKCTDRVFQDSTKAIEHVFNEGQVANPVLMEFNIGPKMVKSENSIKDYETNVQKDPELWTPRKVGERNSGGHAIVSAGSFMLKGKRMIIVLDSNWNEPRVWDMEAYLGGKTAISEMIFHTCH